MARRALGVMRRERRLFIAGREAERRRMNKLSGLGGAGWRKWVLYDNSFRKTGAHVHLEKRLSMLHLPSERTPAGFLVRCARMGWIDSRAGVLGCVAERVRALSASCFFAVQWGCAAHIFGRAGQVGLWEDRRPPSGENSRSCDVRGGHWEAVKHPGRKRESRALWRTVAGVSGARRTWT